MQRQYGVRVFAAAALAVAACLATGPAGAAGPTAEQCLGMTVDFSLPAAEGRLVDYGSDYYGKHHLVLTFFPAAFTPV